MVKIHEYYLGSKTSKSIKPNIYSLDNYFKSIENSLLQVILYSQNGKLGINKIGNNIRVNDNLNKLFANKIDNNIFIKFFENKRAFHKIFIQTLSDYDSRKIINYFILNKELNKDGRIVDQTAISISEIDDEIYKLDKIFSYKQDRIVRFLEIMQFENYIITDNQGYSKYIKLNNA